MANLNLKKKVEQLDVAKKAEPYSRVTIYVGVDRHGDEVYYTAGDDTGKELMFDCPWGTQAMADNVLAQIAGFEYRGFEARKAILDPAAELGDAVTVDGVASRIYSQKSEFDALFSSDIAAPPNAEVDDEYPYQSPELQRERKLASTVATLSVNVDSIEAEVSGKIGETEARSLIRQEVDNIQISVTTGSNANTSKITLTGTGIEAVSDNITMIANKIDLTNANVYGTLAAERITALNKDITLLNNATGTDANTTDKLWVGTHKLVGTFTTPTIIMGNSIRSFFDEYSDVGMIFETRMKPYSNVVEKASEILMKGDRVQITNYDPVNGNAYIEISRGEITFENANGSCTLSQILALL